MLHKETYSAFRQLCMNRGFKCTQQRFAVYQVMKGNRSHPTVDQIWHHVQRKIPSITRESIFRILNELAESGVVYRMDKISTARFDGQHDDHGHLICEECGSITDFELPDGLQLQPASKGFTANHVELRICGVCAKCAKLKNGGETGRQI